MDITQATIELLEQQTKYEYRQVDMIGTDYTVRTTIHKAAHTNHISPVGNGIGSIFWYPTHCCLIIRRKTTPNQPNETIRYRGNAQIQTQGITNYHYHEAYAEYPYHNPEYPQNLINAEQNPTS